MNLLYKILGDMKESDKQEPCRELYYFCKKCRDQAYENSGIDIEILTIGGVGAWYKCLHCGSDKDVSATWSDIRKRLDSNSNEL